MANRHRYEVTEVTADIGNVSIGTILIDIDHYPPFDEPYRTWEFINIETGDPTGYIIAKYLGSYKEKEED